MPSFMDEDFLLRTKTAQTLYHEAAESLPAIDYHCRLSPREIAQNIRFENLSRLMLGNDPEKWRLMLSFGVDEQFIRGDGDDREKFILYADALSHAVGHPLCLQTHLELRRLFGITDPLTRENAGDIFDLASEMLQEEDFRAQRIIDRFNVECLCTALDPTDDLEFLQAIAAENAMKARAYPVFVPDRALNIDKPGFADYIQQLSRVSGMEIRSAADVLTALEHRVEYFSACGARIAHHSLEAVPWGEPSFKQADKAFHAAMEGESVKQKHIDSYRTVILAGLGAMYAQHGWAQQYHIGAMKNNNTAMFRRYGPDVGFDSIGDSPVARPLSRLMDLQDSQGQLPKTILTPLNPAASAVIGTMLGNFQQSGVRGKIQLGAAWRFGADRFGMEAHLRALAGLGVLGAFVGPASDSGSFPGFSRHEIFRRILCDLLGQWAENGECPQDTAFLKTLVEDICCHNARAYFGL